MTGDAMAGRSAAEQPHAVSLRQANEAGYVRGLAAAGRAIPAERPWWWPSSWDMGRAWQVLAMFIVLWWFLCWEHGIEAMGRFAWQACPWCEETGQ